MNYYNILELKPGCTKEEIKKQWRKLSYQYHPDRNSSHDATKKFQQINEAFHYLNDEKNNVDIFNNFSTPNMPDGIFNMLFANLANDLKDFKSGAFKVDLSSNDYDNMFDSMDNDILLSNIFSSIPINNLKKKESIIIEPIIKEITITLEQSYHGDNIPVKILRSITENNKNRDEVETIYIDILPGIDDDEIITIENKGNIVNNKKGNVNLVVKINNETSFIREGLNLSIVKTISFKDSFCGFNFSIDHLNGKTFKLNNKYGNVINTNSTKVIPKLGMKRGEKIGNLIIKFSVVYPEKFTDSQIKLINDNF